MANILQTTYSYAFSLFVYILILQFDENITHACS